MKKALLIILSVFLIYSVAKSQNASTFFPANPGYKWFYKNIPLDSNNIPITSLSTYRIDSFAYVSNYKGLSASHVLSKDNLINFNQPAQWNDTFYYNFQTTNGWEYVQNRAFPDTLPAGLFDPIISFLNSLENWYNAYRFAQTVNSSYTIFTKDTTFNIDTLNLPLRFSFKGKRMNDEIVSTINGNYNCKKFVFTSGISYLIVLPPPLPAIEVPIIQRPDSMWFATDIWLVKEIIPSTKIDLTAIGIPVLFPIPGELTELADPSIGIKTVSTEIPQSVNLYQNYPNPFNAETRIRFDIASPNPARNGTFATLKIYDITGREIYTPVSQYLQSGTYEVRLNASALSSGVYFYRLITEYQSLAKQMILAK